MSNFIFRLGKTTGFQKNWGCVKSVGCSNYDRYRMECELLDGEVLFDVDGTKFTMSRAEEIAIEKAEELFGESDIDFEALSENIREKTMSDTTEDEPDPILYIMDMWDFSPFQDEDSRRERVYKEIQAHATQAKKDLLAEVREKMPGERIQTLVHQSSEPHDVAHDRFFRDGGFNFCRTQALAAIKEIEEGL